MNISNNKMVTFHYILKDSQGKILGSSEGKAPLEYIHGKGLIISGLESALEGKTVGDKFTVVVEPKDAYGEYEPSLVAEISKSQFDEGTVIEPGMMFRASTPDGGFLTVKVTKIEGDKITVDGNHELAGKQLTFDVEIVDVRDATEEELQNVENGCGCCGGDCGGNCDCSEGGCEGCGK